jgi:hypothetical protein
MHLPPNPAGGEAFNRKATPGDVGDSLFRDFLRRVNEKDDGGVLAWLPSAGTRNGTRGSDGEAVAPGEGAMGRGLEALGLGANRVVLSSNDLTKLAKLLERQGLPTGTVRNLFQSLADPNGDIRLDRLLAKLRSLFRETADTASSQVVRRSDVPRIEEALFKMGLGAEQVRRAVEKAAIAGGDLSVRKFLSALRDVFPDLTPKSFEGVKAVLQQETGIRFQPGDLRQVIRKAGLEAELDRLTGNVSQASRHAAKQEIAAFMQEKGIPPGEVKRFLETVRVRSAEGLQNASQQRHLSPPEVDPSVRVYIRRDGRDWQPGGWKGRILDILNRQETPAGRTIPAEAGGGKATAFQDLAGMLEEALSGRNASKPGGKAGQAAYPWTERSPLPAGAGEKAALHTLSGERAAERSGSQQKGAGAEPAGTRSPSGAEFSLYRADRANAVQQAGSVKAANPLPLPEPLPKIVDRMVWMVRAGEQTSRIQISPPELGRLELDVVIRQGHLHANLTAENPAVKELIETNLLQLRQQLNNLGFVVERFEVAAGLGDRRFAENQAQFQGRRGRSGRGRAPEGVVPGNSAGAARSARSPVPGLHRVDVHV